MASLKIWPLLLLQFSLVSMGKDCPYPNFNGNILLSSESRLMNDFPDNSEVTVECSTGYLKKEGSPVVTCVNGNWSPVQLICQRKDCGVPASLPHMTFSIPNGTLFGVHIKPECDRRYDLEGSSYWQCLMSGWRGNSECKLITCDEPQQITNGERIMRNVIPEMDDVIEYSCHENYTLVGNKSITCLEYEYSSSPPQCKLIECEVPEIHSGRRIEGNPPYFYKSEVRFECMPGYWMNGSALAVCGERGWSALPVCEEKHTTSRTTTSIKTTSTPTTSTETTTSTATTTSSNSHLYEKKQQEEELITPLLSNGAVVALCVISIASIFLIASLVLWHNNKHRGANNRTAPLL